MLGNAGTTAAASHLGLGAVVVWLMSLEKFLPPCNTGGLPILLCANWGQQATSRAFWLPPLVLVACEQANVVDAVTQQDIYCV